MIFNKKVPVYMDENEKGAVLGHVHITVNEFEGPDQNDLTVRVTFVEIDRYNRAPRRIAPKAGFNLFTFLCFRNKK